MRGTRPRVPVAGARVSVALLGAALPLTGCSPGGGEDDGANAAVTQRRGDGDPFWADPDSRAAR